MRVGEGVNNRENTVIEILDVEEPVLQDDSATRERVWFTLTAYEKHFFDVPPNNIIELVTAASYLDLKSMYLFACQSIADAIKDKRPAAIRKLFNFEDDLTEGEKAKMIQQNSGF
uniref:SKP1 component dimerisation domain-containing protein n=1 Tax=Ditylenchus dipsaci TaxID=166011 RepID=A0A915CPB4_9BILA